MTYLKRNITLSIFLVVIASSLLMFSSLTTLAADKINIAFATHLKGGGVDEETILKFKEVLEDISDNQFEVDVFVGGVLGNETDLWEQLGDNEIQMNLCGASLFPSYAPGKYVFGVPFLFKNREDMKKLLDSPLVNDIKELVRLNGKILVLATPLRDWRMLTSNKPIRSVDDIKGLKIRMTSIPERIEVWKELGANITTLAGSEIYGALQSGLIEAQDNPASTNVSFKFYEVQKYMTRTNHEIGFRLLLISEEFYNSLTSQQQDWIDEASLQAATYFEEKVEADEEKYIETLKEKGLELTEIDLDEVRKRIIPAIERLRENWDEGVYENYVKPYLQ